MNKVIFIVIAIFSAIAFTSCKEEMGDNQYPPKSKFLKLIKTISFNDTYRSVYEYKYDDLGRMTEKRRATYQHDVYEYRPHEIITYFQPDINTNPKIISIIFTWKNNHITERKYMYANGDFRQKVTNTYNADNQLISSTERENTSDNIKGDNIDIYNYWENGVITHANIFYPHDGSGESAERIQYSYTTIPAKTNIKGVSCDMFIGLEGEIPKYLLEKANDGTRTFKYQYELDSDGCPTKINQLVYANKAGESTATIVSTATITYY